jgi:hypothetical protein
MRPSWRTFAKIGAVIAVINLAAYVSHWATLGPEANCKTSSMAESWAPDHGYKATVLEKDCNLGESILYSVRLDAFSPPERTAWFTTRELETDDRAQPPELDWSSARQLEITMATRTLGGRLTEHVGDHLTIVRVFSAAKPDAFPNF